MKYDAIVIGSGPNGLAAAIALAQRGKKVKIFEAASVVGGGMRSENLTLDGFIHDVCSTVDPLAVASPFFRSLNLERFGLRWIHSPAAAAHPLDTESAALLLASVDETAEQLGEDGKAYRELMGPLAKRWEDIFSEVLRPPLHFPKSPFLLARFGLKSITDAESFIKKNFRSPKARALLGGIAAHANLPLSRRGTNGISLMLTLAAHARGWPLVEGGSQQLANALVTCFRSLGGEIEVNHPVQTLRELPPSNSIFFDLTPAGILPIISSQIRVKDRNDFNNYRYGPGVFKMDWALSEPIPWADKKCALAATVHLGGTLEEIVESEHLPGLGKCPRKPFVLLTQPSLFDPSRSPTGKHTAWAYCHVPNGSEENMVERIEQQIERYAPGFKKIILKRISHTTSQMQMKNSNLVGGDISGGQMNLKRMLLGPLNSLNPYKLPVPSYYICSSSTPPGPGVHGMCGYNAVQAALAEE